MNLNNLEKQVKGYRATMLAVGTTHWTPPAWETLTKKTRSCWIRNYQNAVLVGTPRARGSYA